MQGNLINLFMWGFQQHMLISFQVSSESLFRKLDYKLDPKVFFIGILTEERTDRHPICIEPEDCGFSTHSFADVKKLASELENVDEERRIFHSHEIAQENHNRRITAKSYVEAINKILKRDDIYGEKEYFVAAPTHVEGFLVFTVLSLNKSVVNRYYSLTKDKQIDRFTIYRSLIESSIHSLLKECSIALKDPNNSMGAIDRSAEELLRDAGRQFIYTVSGAGRNFSGLHGFYDACNEIASMRYEGAVGLGKIIVAPKDHKNVKVTLQLKNPIRIRDYRKVRKFLEISDFDSSLICDSALIYGLGELRGKYNPKEESLFVINFTSHFKWELTHDNNPLMVVEYREPRLPEEKINREKFYLDFPRLFQSISKDQIDDLWDLSLEATKQKHGTMLVISDEALNESERLGKQSFPLKPLKLTDKVIQQITAIDGAVLLDRDSNCHAIGVILDGIATEKGDASRGARYNSAIRYYEQFGQNKSLIIVIISEDGMINLIPDLKPQIKRSSIVESIEEFKNILNLDNLNHKSFNYGMTHFQTINFYLTEEECEQINITRKLIEEKFKKDLIMVHIVYEDLKSNPDMNESYYKE
ncbi:diadenylate cyclase [Flavobacterium sp. SUN052]|uniref:DNA integrity scanning protein DisA nucleotide-binding domain protein n=1 Tax=Flavobacterium sp. SUN052 TaxID=3002441 RepID=UPI00237EDBFE|nr:diadenylate cyclase [Flavobacterium sp. SUN052]MEC4004831.1 diadenylate cyclase [Flavobacterium sp. SUN052]